MSGFYGVRKRLHGNGGCFTTRKVAVYDTHAVGSGEAGAIGPEVGWVKFPGGAAEKTFDLTCVLGVGSQQLNKVVLAGRSFHPLVKLCEMLAGQRPKPELCGRGALLARVAELGGVSGGAGGDLACLCGGWLWAAMARACSEKEGREQPEGCGQAPQNEFAVKS